jgi:subtilisin-like proprotein convertase family protein
MARLVLYSSFCILAFEFALPVLSHLVFDSCDADGTVAYEACDPSTNEINIHKCAPLIHFDADVDPIPFFSTIHISESIACSNCGSGSTVTSVKIHVNFFHEWLGDVQVFLLHNGAKRRQVFGVLQPPYGSCANDDVDAIFYDAAAGVAFDGSVSTCSIYPALTGDHEPIDSFDVYIGDSIAGDWALEINDVTHLEPGDGWFGEWTLTLSVQECPQMTYVPSCTPTVCCVDSCSGMANGNYQSCSTCEGYVSCSNGYTFNMPCAPANPPLVWDDTAQTCAFTSTTCPYNPASVAQCV